MNTTVNSAAWREPMVWLVAGLPATVVIASVWLLVRLSGAPSPDAVRDEVQRVSQVQVTDLAPDERAQQLGLRMLLSVMDDRLELRNAAGGLREAGTLRLVLAHPLEASQDREVTLQPVGDAWQAPGTLPPDHDWNVTLVPADGSWRLTGRLSRDDRAAMLRPALAAP